MNYLLSPQILSQIISSSDIAKKPTQLKKFCLADYVSKVDVIYPKGNKLPETVEYRNDDSISEDNSRDENESSEDEALLRSFEISKGIQSSKHPRLETYF